MHETDIPISRRAWLKKCGALVTSLAIIPVVAWQRPAIAGAASRNAFHYRDHPSDGQHCSECFAFIPAGTEGNRLDACRVLSGPVSPNGWCMAYASREG